MIGGIATDLSMAAYRLEKGDNTGALLSTLAAVPVLGIPFNVVDVARDLGAFEDGGILDKIDFLNLFRLNKEILTMWTRELLKKRKQMKILTNI